MSGFPKFLKELHAAGQHDSEGTFTIDLESQRSKLERYRLPSANHFILCLLSAAVSSQASRFDVTPDGSDLHVSFDGHPFRRQELEKLDTFLFQTSTESLRFRELAAALHASRALGMHAVELLSYKEGEGVFLLLDQRGVRLEDLPEISPFLDQRVTEMTIRFRSPLARLMGAPRGKAERALLERWGRFAPLRLFFGHDLLSIDRIRAWPIHIQIQGQARPSPNIRLASCPLETQHRWSGYIGFDHEPGGLLLISSGLRFQRPAPPAYPMAHAVIWVEGLEKDLSALQLLEDQALQDILETINLELDALLERTIQNLAHGSGSSLLRACARAAVHRHKASGVPLPVALRDFPCFEEDGRLDTAGEHALRQG